METCNSAEAVVDVEKGRWVLFHLCKCIPGRKTNKWDVLANDKFLGTIEWYAGWRKYCFYPRENTLYEEDCLRDIAEFMQGKTLRHKQALRKKGDYQG